MDHLKYLLVLSFLFTSSLLAGQSMLRLGVFYEPWFDEEDIYFSVGYERDVHPRLSIAGQISRSMRKSTYLTYRSAYYFSSNLNASFYLGPTVGIHHVNAERNFVFVPIGMRMGYRGNLHRLFSIASFGDGDLGELGFLSTDYYAGFLWNPLGSREFSHADPGRSDHLERLTFVVGIDLCFRLSKGRNF